MARRSYSELLTELVDLLERRDKIDVRIAAIRDEIKERQGIDRDADRVREGGG